MPITAPPIPPLGALPIPRDMLDRAAGLLPGVPDPRESFQAGWDDLKRTVTTAQASVMWGAVAVVALVIGLVLVSGVASKAAKIVVSVAGSAGKAVKTKGVSVAGDVAKGASDG